MPTQEELLRAHRESVKERLRILANMIRDRIGNDYFRGIAGEALGLKNGLGEWATTGERRNKWAELGAIYNFVDKRLRYTNDPDGYDVFYPAEMALRHGIGDCDEQTQMVGVLAGTVGYPVKIRAVSIKGNGRFTHVYPLVGLDLGGGGIRWVPMDVTHRRGVGQAVVHREALEERI